ncbi:DUF2849 domain-containing protein [Pseudochrobactrum algeriensis]|uniref:DUF2849 domain-containing protein n=1 Tax=Pseudochrobactrum algeriensis TaxID=2834768 RepID=UPI001BD0EF34|nr:DUF2849 domain-containing protein [Pseudochrobactrum algeriensis]MBX8813124.1 DUF2849 domain-containing protein [Ochrobactrum sp. MR34]QVQ37033.1 DUF2849 domain-containing protein [Pseudochrobactrum algeriensis]QVQ40249.1 DUF2849 domain-containing protein [Pseudochrobactrum algeriensis]QVQ44172.1 DUF2849 domain-containing protein [Pseudochrobactrum algeriensis]
MTVKVLSANRLSDGVSVWLAADGHWASSIRGALLARHPEAVAALEAAGQQASRFDEVVDINLIDVEEHGDELLPVRLRERIRLSGPTITPVVRLHSVAG